MEQKQDRTKSFEFEINILSLLKEIAKKIWLILLVGIIAGVGTFVVTKLVIKPLYRSSFTAYVNNQQKSVNTGALSSSDVSASKELVRTYSKVLTSKTLLKSVSEALNLNYGYTTLKDMVSTEIQEETEIITVYVVSESPENAYLFAQELAKESPDYIKEIVEGSSMKVIDFPELNDNKFKPSYFNFGIWGFLIGAALVIIYVIIRYLIYMADDKVKSAQEVEDRFPTMPFLGIIPDVDEASTGNYYYYSDMYHRYGGQN